MIETFNYICIKEILNKCLRHPLLKDLDLEDAIYYTLDFIRTMGLPHIYTDKEEELIVKDYRTPLPCDCIKVNQIATDSGIVLRYMLQTFKTGVEKRNKAMLAYKLQGNVLYTNFPEGRLRISYKAIKVDDEGLPMLPDNPTFIKALESYIKKECFTVLFDCGKLDMRILNNAQADWAFQAAHCRAAFLIPSEDEMETIGSIVKRMLPRLHDHAEGYSNTHDKEILKRKNPRSY